MVLGGGIGTCRTRGRRETRRNFFLPIALTGALWIYGYQYVIQKQSGRWVINKAGIVVVSLAVFTAAAMPALVQRAEAFGSPFDYGENSKRLVTDYSKVWSD